MSYIDDLIVTVDSDNDDNDVVENELDDVDNNENEENEDDNADDDINDDINDDDDDDLNSELSIDDDNNNEDFSDEELLADYNLLRRKHTISSSSNNDDDNNNNDNENGKKNTRKRMSNEIDMTETVFRSQIEPHLKKHKEEQTIPYAIPMNAFAKIVKSIDERVTKKYFPDSEALIIQGRKTRACHNWTKNAIIGIQQLTEDMLAEVFTEASWVNNRSNPIKSEPMSRHLQIAAKPILKQDGLNGNSIPYKKWLARVDDDISIYVDEYKINSGKQREKNEIKKEVKNNNNNKAKENTISMFEKE